MKSMTGFGRATGSLPGGYACSLELASVNRKHVEVSTSLPRDWQALEVVATERIRKRIHRGKVHVSAQITATAAQADGLRFDSGAVTASYRKLETLAAEMGVSTEADLRLILDLAREHRDDTLGIDLDSAAEPFGEIVDAALDRLEAMRDQEGAALKDDLALRIGNLDTQTQTVSKLREGLTEDYRENLMNRLRQADLEIDLEDVRVLREVALFAERIDVTEELTRLASHITQFREVLDLDEPVGRKLDFLLQEIHREVNTIGSKSNHLETTKLVLDAKGEVDRLREQVQNVE